MSVESGFRADGRWMAWGLVLGLLTGAGLSLWFAPRSGGSFRAWLADGVQRMAQRTRSRIEDAASSDPVAQSLAEGKEAARKRREGMVA
ncbi:MAG: YtxH domain-containing protein [Anaerolineae bacterium]|nr:YtxH domain-containing protein [Anaerolineae bacterium]